ncbi:MAG: hypothetical protein ACI8ZO_001590 [Flavobacteriales bacterium]|jgi:hypothetical protein
MKHKILLYILLVLLPTLAFAHKFYVSIAEIDRKPESLQISIKLFTDDLELGLGKFYKEDLKIEAAIVDSLLEDYLSQRLKISVGDSLLTQTLIGKEVVYDVTWVYVELPYALPIKSLDVENLILLEYNEEQSNITNVKDQKGMVESYMYTPSRKIYTFTLNE